MNSTSFRWQGAVFLLVGMSILLLAGTRAVPTGNLNTSVAGDVDASCTNLTHLATRASNELGFTSDLTFAFNWTRGTSALFSASFVGIEQLAVGERAGDPFVAFAFEGSECKNLSGDKGVTCGTIKGRCYDESRCGQAEISLNRGVGPFDVTRVGTNGWAWQGRQGGTATLLGTASSTDCQ